MKLEYRIREIESIEQLNLYGLDEWELIGIIGTKGYFKRELK